MTDRPIIFSGPMVLALLAGRKTQTRRILKPVPGVTFADLEWETTPFDQKVGRVPRDKLRVPYAIGDRLYVRESLGWNRDGDNRFFYRADNADVPAGQIPHGYKITNTHAPSIHMPRWASRITLAISDVRVQRLGDISEEDAKAEGCVVGKLTGHAFEDVAALRLGGAEWKCARDWFADLWETLHGDTAWTDNPWVVAVTFTVEHRNIDAAISAAA